MKIELSDEERKARNNERAARYRETHREAANEAARRWRINNPERYKIGREKAKEDNKKRRKKVIDYYGGKCKCCGESEIKFLAIDHINGSGRKHRFSVCAGSSERFYQWIDKNYPDYLQVLCHNCNLAKGFYGSCPHNNED